MGGYIGKGQGVVLVDGYTKAQTDSKIANAREIEVSATQPTNPSEGDVWYDSSTGNKLLKYYDGNNWYKVSPVIPSITSISGSIVSGFSGVATITLTGTGFLSDTCTVKFSATGISDQNVTVTATSDTSLTVTAPSAVYNLSAGTVVDISVRNADSGESVSSSTQISNPPSGGSITDSGGYRYHYFNSSSSFVNTVPSLSVEYLTVAGGGGGGANNGENGGGGGGAGGYLSGSFTASATTYGITVGAGGAAGRNNGANSAIAGVATAIGGGGGGYNTGGINGNAGGSGGGAGRDRSCAYGAGTSGQGNRGGCAGGSTCSSGGGGGGAGQVGFDGEYDCGTGYSNANSSKGGDGLTWLNGTTYAGGGGGTYEDQRGGYGGAGGGGAGGRRSSYAGTSGSSNTGGGGGAGQGSAGAGAGGSGIVIIRYAI
jgi:hypothetical protein